MERGKKKLFFGIIFILIFVMASSVFAESIGLSANSREAIDKVMDNQGIDKDNIKSVEKVNFEELPDQVNLENIDTTNLAVYEVDYGGEAPVFVVTASDEMFATPETDTTVYKRMFLNFGFNGRISDSTFLDSATGVEGSSDKGYVMMREGSITGLSTSLEILEGQGNVEIILNINGDPVGFRNTIAADSAGAKKDYDTQSLGVVEFEKGDIISVSVKIDGNVVVKDVINLVEISTE
jgi:hypothetical protein